jgi:hypothetical protein
MSLYLEWLSRVVPPRPANLRVVAANNASQAIALASDIYTFTQNNSPQSYGTALLRIQNSDATNAIFVNFGPANITANSAATSGNTVCSEIPAAQDREFEVNPSVDSYMAVVTANGTANTATIRYWIVSWPKSGTSFGA